MVEQRLRNIGAQKSEGLTFNTADDNAAASSVSEESKPLPSISIDDLKAAVKKMSH